MPTPERFDRYERLRPLGRGDAMGSTFQAYDRTRREDVVLKLLKLEVDQEVLDAQRLGVELQKRLAERCSQVPAVFDHGEKEGFLYAAMQLVPGRDLSVALKAEGKIAPQVAVQWVRQLCEILQISHALCTEVNGDQITAVVHSDIKLENLRVSDGHIYLIDFGTAKGLSALRPSVQNNFATPPNTPSEYQTSGRMVDMRTDLWAAGVVLYRLICGHSPFVDPPPGLDAEERDHLILESVRLAELQPVPESCPPAVRSILYRALAHTAARRYSTAADFAHDLDAFLHDQPVAPETIALGETSDPDRTRRTTHDAGSEAARKTAAAPFKTEASPRLPRHRPWRWLGGGGFALLVIGAGIQVYSWTLANRAVEEVSTKAEPDFDQAGALLADANRWSVFALKRQNDQVYEALMRDAEALFTTYRENRRVVYCSEWQKIQPRVDLAVTIRPRDPRTKARQLYVYGQIKRIAAKDPKKGGNVQPSEAVLLLEQAAESDPTWPDPFVALVDIYGSDQLLDYERTFKAIEAAQARGHQPTSRQKYRAAVVTLKQCLRFQKDAGRRSEASERRPRLEQALQLCQTARSLFDEVASGEDIEWSLDRTKRALKEISAALEALDPLAYEVTPSRGNRPQ